MTSTAITLERNVVYFRFASDSAVEKVEFHGRDIAVGDLKQVIAERKALPKFDLVLSNEATGDVYAKDGALVSRNTIVIVKRTPPQSRKALPIVDLDVAQRAVVWDKKSLYDGNGTLALPVTRRPCPKEYLCPVCHGLFNNPSIARCCGRSACARCFDAQEGDTCIIDGCGCPLCGRAWSEQTTPIPNRSLAQSVAALDLAYFELPDSSKKKQAKMTNATSGAQTGNLEASATGLRPISDGVTLKPCVLTPEQFLMWQQSIAEDSSSDDEDARKRRKKEKKKKEKKRKSSDKGEKMPAFEAMVVSPLEMQHSGEERKHKKRRSS